MARTTGSTVDALTASLDYPLLVVTASDGREIGGCLVGFWTQCSIDPVRLMVCLSRTNHTFRVAAGADSLVVHVLRESDRALAARFGTETADARVDKFAGLVWTPGPGGAPVIEGCDWFGGPVLDRVDTGDHVGHLLHVTDAGAARSDERQLGFAQVRDLEPGHAP